MRRMVDTKPAIALLAGIVAALGALNWHLLGSTVDISPLSPPRGSADAPPLSSVDLASPLDNKPASQFEQTVGRQLFSPSRRPAKREVAAAGPDTPPGDLRLVGVMKSGDEPPRALIRSANAQSGKWITEGEQFNGWTLRKISVRSVTVESGGRSHELMLAAPRGSSEDAPDPERGGKRR